MKKTIIIVYLLLTSLCSFSKSIFDKINSPIPKEELIADFDTLINTIETHPGLFNYTTKNEWSTLKFQQRQKIDDSCSIIDFYRITAKLVAKIGCVHTWLTSTRFNFFANPLKPIRYLPYKVIILNEKLYVTQNLSKNEEIPIGSEITHINNTPTNKILYDLINLMSADAYNQYFRKKVLSEEFYYFYHSLYDYRDKNILTYVHESDTISKNIQLTKLQKTKKKKHKKEPLQFNINDSLRTATLTISTFAFYKTIDKFNQFVDSSLAQYHKHNLEHLIIDLRGNQGGTPECAAHLLRYFYKAPFKYYTIDQGYYPHLTKPITPFAKLVIENPIILIDGFGVSTTGHFCAMLKVNGLATFIGEETGSTYFCYSNVKMKILANSKLTLRIAQQRFEVNASELQKSKGISPSHEVIPNIQAITSEEDIVLMTALELIKKMHNTVYSK